MVLSKAKIEAYLQEGKIQITPFGPLKLKEASYTFTIENTITLKPGEFFVILTKERVKLATGVCCFLSTRGSVAQQGVDTLQSSTFVEPLSDGQLKLEMKNNNIVPVTLEEGTPITKGIFVEVF